jgi:inorganic pyrophosphatase
MNLWHDVSRGDDTPNELNCIIEIPKGSPNKYEIDKKTGLIALDRANYSSAPYPFDYGEWKHFFETYKELKEKDVIVKIEGIKGKAEAIEAVKKSIELYDAEFKK